jgi:hypothetical protein
MATKFWKLGIRWMWGNLPHTLRKVESLATVSEAT